MHEGKEVPLNVLRYRWDFGEWPAISFTNIATIGAFAGYAGGGGMANSTYSNFVRDKGWGMGRLVGALPSAVGGRHITLSHVGTQDDGDDGMKRVIDLDDGLFCECRQVGNRIDPDLHVIERPDVIPCGATRYSTGSYTPRARRRIA